MKKRYQIFISSTFADLKDERRMVMQAVLERKCFPAGMELFPAIDKKQFDYIKKVIDDSDYYLLIIGARYGSLDENGISYTEKEYDYAVKKNIPVIAFLHSDIKSIPLGKTDMNSELQEKLERFKEKVQTGRLVNYWENAHDLKAKVISSLVDVFEDQPKVGWMRNDSKEIDKLQKENKKLKLQAKKKDKSFLEMKQYYEMSEKKVNELQTELNSLQKNLEELKRQEKDRLKDFNSLSRDYQSAKEKILKLKTELDYLNNELKKHKATNKKKEKDIITLEQTNRASQDTLKSLGRELERILKVIKSPKTIQKEYFRLSGIIFNMVLVDGGTFQMGSTIEKDIDTKIDESPLHMVTLSSYWIGETQVTQALWSAVMGTNPSCFTGDLRRPVERVSWFECQEFIDRLNVKLEDQLSPLGLKFRLPTEAEWEFAARGGNNSKGYKYAGDNDIAQVAWYSENSEGETHPVGEHAPNELGLFDMSGNVWEWCQDWYGLYTKLELSDPTGPTDGHYRVFRGGSWRGGAQGCRSTDRYRHEPRRRKDNLGFRLAL